MLDRPTVGLSRAFSQGEERDGRVRRGGPGERGGPPNPADRPNRNVARGEATRGQLIVIATRMFAERGYEDTSIEAVLREAGVSRGSLYHHFASKEALFEAVAEEVETSVGAQTVAAASGSQGPVEALRAGFAAWIQLAGDPVVQRILLIDGPSVLGWERWRAMEEHHALGLVRAVLQIIADQGKLRQESVGTLAHMLLASVNEVAPPSPVRTTRRPRCRPAPTPSTSCCNGCLANGAPI